MGKQKFTVTGPAAVGGVAPGGEVEVDASDPLVQLNIQAGILTATPSAEAAVMTCPLCLERGLKHPPKLHTPDELAEHYTERHAGFETPEWRTD
jgi:hypothetical protein